MMLSTKVYLFICFLFFLQDDILCLFQVCLEISPTDTNLVVKCCKLLCKVLPKLGVCEENVLKNTITWTLSCIFYFKAHVQHSEQINEILNFYVYTIQTFRNLNINNNKVRNYYCEIMTKSSKVLIKTNLIL